MLVLKSIVASVIGAALVAVVSVLIGEFGSLSWRLLGTLLLFVLFSLMSWYDAEVSARRAAWFGFASAGVSVYLFAAGMLKIWFPAASSSMIEDFLAWGWLVLVARIALLHVHLLIVQQAKFTSAVMSKVNTGTFGLVIILAVMLSLPALLVDLTYGELYWRILFAVAILDVLGTVLIPLVYVLFHRPARPAPQPMQLEWPRYTNGHPVPALPNGLPDLNAPAGALAWPRYVNGQPVPALPDGSPDLSATLR